MASSPENLSRFFWLWLPLFIMAAQICIGIFLPRPLLALLHSEQGPHEALEFLVLVIAFIIALAALPHIDRKQNKWLFAWVALAAACCFYVAGEEVSWGQKFVQWSTPEFWAHINDQNETNLHNTSSWFDQKPRLILLIGVSVGGLLIPLLGRFRPQWLPGKFSVIYPPATLGVTAGITLGFQILDKADKAMKDVVLLERGSEVVELYLFYFVLLYLIILRRRILQDQR